MGKRTLEITTVNQCTVMCKFCPQQLYIDRFRQIAPSVYQLSEENFKLALSHTPKGVQIDFSGYSEPFLNPNAHKMILYAYQNGYDVVLYTTLVGLTLDKLQQLKEVKFKTIVLHTLDNLHNANIPITQNYKDVLVEFMQNFRVDGFSTMNENFVSNDRAGLAYGAKPIHHYGPIFCEKLSSPQFVMLPNGDVQLCCMDWGLRHKLGNLFVQTYEEIVKSEPYKKIKKNKFALDGDTLCRSCKWALPPTQAGCKRNS